MNKAASQVLKYPFPTTWDLTHLYRSPHDPNIEKDLENSNQKRAAFAKKYAQQSDYLRSESLLLEALTDYEQLLNDLSGAKPLMYFSYLTAIESNNITAHAKLNKITTQLTKAYNQLAFFPVQLGKIDPALQSRFLASTSLSRYHYFLRNRFELAKYDLEENQEKIVNLYEQTGYQMWVEGVEKTLNNLTVSWQGKSWPLSQAMQTVAQLPTAQRRSLHRKILTKASSLKAFAESELNAIVTHKAIEDDLRGLKKPYLSRVLAAENDPVAVETLVETVTQSFNLSHRFYQIKAKLLKLDKLEYADRNAKIETNSYTYSFTNAQKLIENTFHSLSPQFQEILHRLIEKGQTDIFPRKNKTAGAFCSSSTNNPTYVLLNYIDDLDSVTTFAHEFGHAIHSELSKSQPVHYQHYSTSLAETASTFFEQLVFNSLVAKLPAHDRLMVLHNKIQDDINTVFRQIALFNFELELHQHIRDQGYLDCDQIGQLLNKHMASYLGPSVSLSKLDGRFFILWPHIRNFFYTYTYAFGHLVSKVLVQRIKQKPKAIDGVIALLSAGSRDKPENLLKEAGIDLSQPQFFQEAIRTIETEIEQLEKMA